MSYLPFFDRNKTINEKIARILVDERVVLSHQCNQPLSRFSTWMLIVTGGLVAFLVSNLAEIHEVLPRDPFVIDCLKYSIFAGFIAKAINVFVEFAYSAAQPLGLTCLKVFKEIDTFFDEQSRNGERDDTEEEPLTRETLFEAAKKEAIGRTPFPIRALVSRITKENSEEDDRFRFKALALGELAFIVFLVLQTLTFVVAVGAGLDMIQRQVMQLIEAS